ncbi:MAG: acetolactate synthase large subunit [Spirochaetales bacterium]|nr:acetolactate synthase large subunit [Spirochaetales bacterium]
MKISGAELFVKALKAEGVKHLFGFPGGVVIPVFDVLYSEPEIKVILARHEQGAVHAADGYARSTGKTGVCLVTSGPGATNTVTGIATANFDSVPIVCFTGQVSRSMIGNDAFQEADIVGITRPITKHNYLVLDRKDLGRILKEAFTIANSGRPGPVLVDLPKDVILEKGDDEYPARVSIRGYNPVLKGHPNQIKRAAAELKKAKRPLFYVGGGLHISGAVDVFRKAVKKTGVPVVHSLMGTGAIPGDDPLSLGMLGMHGTYVANMAVSHSDLLFGIGNRFDDRATGELAKFAPGAKIVHIDQDPVSISRNVPVEVPIVGDARHVLEQLLPLLEAPETEAWLGQIEDWRREHDQQEQPEGGVKAPGTERTEAVRGRKAANPGKAASAAAAKAKTESGQGSGGHLRPDTIIQAICKVFPDAIIATEVGQNQMWASQFYTFRHSRSLLTSGGLGTMGYGFPAAIGAQIANPDKRVIDIAGDGSIQMNIQELATAVYNELPVIVAILNNGFLGMVRQWQELFFGRRYSSTCLMRGENCPPECEGQMEGCPVYHPDFVKLAEAYGAVGLRVVEDAQIEPALKQAEAIKDRPVFIDFLVEREFNVFPMVAPGAGNAEMMFSEGGQS